MLEEVVHKRSAADHQSICEIPHGHATGEQEGPAAPSAVLAAVQWAMNSSEVGR
jgi:hypothetical protein